MRLQSFDDKKVRLVCIDGNTYEGTCVYQDKEYCELEYGRREEALQIQSFLFYKRDIKEVVEIDSFSEPYGLLEKEIVEEGVIFIEQVFENEDEEEILRLLCYLKDHSNKITDEVIEEMKSLRKYTKNQDIIKMVNEMIGGE